MKLGKFNVKKQPRRLVHDLSVGEVDPITGSVEFEETKTGDWMPRRVFIQLPYTEDSTSLMRGYPRMLGSMDGAEAQQMIAVMREIIAIVDNAQETK